MLSVVTSLIRVILSAEFRTLKKRSRNLENKRRIYRLFITLPISHLCLVTRTLTSYWYACSALALHVSKHDDVRLRRCRANTLSRPALSQLSRWIC